MILQLNPPIPVITQKGPALAHALIDYGPEHDLHWVCFQDSTGECWTWNNAVIRARKNITQGRDYVAPFYEPKDVGFKHKNSECDEHCICDECGECTDDCECERKNENDVDWEAAYHEKMEELEEEKENFKDCLVENRKLDHDLNQLKDLIRKLIKDDHVFHTSREDVKRVLNEMKEPEELPF